MSNFLGMGAMCDFGALLERRGITISGTMRAEEFLTIETLLIYALGMVAFISALVLGIAFTKIAYFLTRGKINPFIGATAISAFPMAGRTAHMTA